MSLIMFEGFETHETLTDLSLHGPGLNNTQTLLTSADGNSIGPRGGGYGCWKGTSTSTGTWNTSQNFNRDNYWPRIFMKPPAYQTQPTDTSGTFGFAFFPKLTGEQVWSDGEAFFTPLAAVCDAAGTPHFFIGINSALTLVVYRWGNSPAASWNSNLIGHYFGNYSSLTGYTTPWTMIPISGSSSSGQFGYEWQQSQGYGARFAIPLASKFTLIGSGGTLAFNEWNYIECKTTIRNNSTGSLQVKLNRTVVDSTLDIDVSSVQTTAVTNNVIGGIAVGQFLGYVSNMFSGNRSSCLGSIGMVTYYDDFYWCDSTATSGSNPFNSFLGPIYVRSVLASSVVSRTMPTVVGASDLIAIGGRFSSTSLTNYVESNDKNQTTVFNVSEPSQSNVIAACLLTSGYETAAPTAQFHVSANYNSGTATIENPTLVNTNRGFRLLLPKAPDDTSWTPAKLAATNFVLEHK